MTVEVIIPSLRQEAVEWLVASLVLQTQPPDVITVVSNETQPFTASYSIPTRLVRFESDDYSIGDLDVALRQNVGLWAAQSDVIIIQGDDQVAPPTMIEDSLTELGPKEYLWGNHRLMDFAGKTLDEIRLADPKTARSREYPIPPAFHGYQSCYGGMFVTQADFIRDVGGFDMAFNGRHGSEDQALGYRLQQRSRLPKVWITEPPFSWHGLELQDGDTRSRNPWLEPIRNGCASHRLTDRVLDNTRYQQCEDCPYRSFSDVGPLLRKEPLIKYQPELVRTRDIWL